MGERIQMWIQLKRSTSKKRLINPSANLGFHARADAGDQGQSKPPIDTKEEPPPSTALNCSRGAANLHLYSSLQHF